MREYCRQFERLSSTLADVPEDILEGQFVNGLDPMILAELLVNKPNEMSWIIQMAQWIESKNRTLKQIKGSTHGGSKGGFAGANGGPRGSVGSITRGTTPTEKSSGHRIEVPFKRMSDAES